MCQISVSNLGDDFLNKEIFLILGANGSLVHDDGWGYCSSTGEYVKTRLSMYLTSNTGAILAESRDKKNSPIIGHIRQASPKVPVCDENAHPFVLDGMFFVHNGKLAPYDESKFDIEYSVDEVDPKDNKTKSVTYRRSDSLVFFEYFHKNFLLNSKTELDEEKCFVQTLRAIMDEFYGKFAMVFLINGKTYVVRGKTADLHISYRFDSEKDNAKILGWVINTERRNLLHGTLLQSNLHQLREKKVLHYSDPSLLAEETIFVAEPLGLRKIGEIKENPAPVKVYSGGSQAATNFPSGNTWTGSAIDAAVLKYGEEIFKFLSGYSLSLSDFQNILSEAWNASILEITEEMAKYLVEKVFPLLKNESQKDIRKDLKKALGGFPVYSYRYRDGMDYPWFMNSKEVQVEFVKSIAKEK